MTQRSTPIKTKHVNNSFRAALDGRMLIVMTDLLLSIVLWGGVAQGSNK
jgi:hypothetical protein